MTHERKQKGKGFGLKKALGRSPADRKHLRSQWKRMRRETEEAHADIRRRVNRLVDWLKEP